MFWVPVGNTVQAFPEVKSVRFADTAFLPDLSLQELLAVFREKKVPLSLGKHPREFHKIYDKGNHLGNVVTNKGCIRKNSFRQNLRSAVRNHFLWLEYCGWGDTQEHIKPFLMLPPVVKCGGTGASCEGGERR